VIQVLQRRPEARIWDVASGKDVPAPVSDKHVSRQAQAPDGKVALTFDGADTHVHIWDPVTAKALAGVPLDKSGVSYLEFSPDSKVLAVGTGNTVQLVEVATGKPWGPGALQTESGIVTRILFSPDGQLPIGLDRTTRLLIKGRGLYRGPKPKVTLKHSGTQCRIRTVSPVQSSPKSIPGPGNPRRYGGRVQAKLIGQVNRIWGLGESRGDRSSSCDGK